MADYSGAYKGDPKPTEEELRLKEENAKLRKQLETKTYDEIKRLQAELDRIEGYSIWYVTQDVTKIARIRAKSSLEAKEMFEIAIKEEKKGPLSARRE